jgi:hypothetical protein
LGAPLQLVYEKPKGEKQLKVKISEGLAFGLKAQDHLESINAERIP